MTPDIVNKYEAMLKAGESVYLDPIEIDQIFRYYADNNQVSKLEDILRLGLNLHPDDPTIMQLDAEYTLMTNDAESALMRFFRRTTPSSASSVRPHWLCSAEKPKPWRWPIWRSPMRIQTNT